MNRMQEKFEAVFPGSFDPFQNGHFSTVISFLKLNPKAFLYIVIGVNDEKLNGQTFTTEEKIFLIRQTIPKKYLKRIKIVPYSKIIANYLYEQNIQMFVKGVRDRKDFEYESWIATVNSLFSGSPKTMLIPQTNPVLTNVSSSNFKNFVKWGLKATDFAPALTREALELRLRGQLLVGVTGGIGAGKSTFAKKIEDISKENGNKNRTRIYHINLDDLGKVIHSADKTPRFLQIRKQIAKKFGRKLMRKDTSIDTHELGKIVFSSPEKLQKLTEMMMEAILYLLRKKLEELGKGIFLIEGANLVEQGLTDLVNENIIHIKANRKAQEERLTGRGLSNDQIKRRIDFQLNDKERVSIIQGKQKKEKHRLFMKVNSLGKIDAEGIYKKLQKEYKTRSGIIR
ncbi:MAG: dephospho-CoA kinase [Candidatus Paceibacterota bacterium]